MSVWIIFAVMIAIGLGGALWPLRNRRSLERAAGGASGDDGRVAKELAVYRDQLGQVDADLGAGVLAANEADAAKAEISRRMLAASDRIVTAGGRRGSGIAQTAVVVAGVMLITAGSVALYLLSGNPNLKDMPYAGRQAESPKGQTLEILVQRAEAQLRKTPDNVQGWKVLAPSYKRLRRYSDAKYALEQIMRLEGRRAATLAEYGEAVMMAQAGVISDKARKAFDEAVRLDAKQPKALYYLAMAHAQDGDPDAALKALRHMLTVLPENSPWRRRVAGIVKAGETRKARAARPGPGPDKDALKAARQMTPAQRREMIEGMVARLAGRMAENPNDLGGWLRLIRAYKVLGKTTELKTALATARKTFADKPEALKRIAAVAAQK